MKERPIIFSGPMIQALLNGTKSQTRRVIKPQPKGNVTSAELWADGLWRIEHEPVERDGGGNYIGLRIRCPYEAGQRLWVRETWRIMSMPEDPILFQYKADMGIEEERGYENCGWTWERYEQWYERQNRKLQEDCDRAGLPNDEDAPGYNWTIETCPTRWQPSIHMPKFAARIWLSITNIRVERLQEISEADAIAEGWSRDEELFPAINVGSKALAWFRDLWDKLNLKRGYGFDTNPWVWIVEFSVV